MTNTKRFKYVFDPPLPPQPRSTSATAWPADCQWGNSIGCGRSLVKYSMSETLVTNPDPLLLPCPQARGRPLIEGWLENAAARGGLTGEATTRGDGRSLPARKPTSEPPTAQGRPSQPGANLPVPIKPRAG